MGDTIGQEHARGRQPGTVYNTRYEEAGLPVHRWSTTTSWDMATGQRVGATSHLRQAGRYFLDPTKDPRTVPGAGQPPIDVESLRWEGRWRTMFPSGRTRE